MATVGQALKEGLVGAEKEDPQQYSAQHRAEFMKNAAYDEENDQWYMSRQEFVDAIAPINEDYHKIKREAFTILFAIADRRDEDRILLSDWSVFQNLLLKPDAEYEIAFRMFADPATGMVNFVDFKEAYARNRSRIPFDWNSPWAKLYVGDEKNRHSMTYPQFAQMLRGLQGERIRQAFLHFDKKGVGYIEPEEFQIIIMETASHKLSDHLLQNLPTLCNISAGSKISYANMRAFHNIISQMDLIELIVRSAIAKSADGKITRVDFLNEAARITRFTLFTPMEADILFHFASLDQPAGRLGLQDFQRVLDASWHSGPSGYEVPFTTSITLAQQRHVASESIWHDVGAAVHHFILGSISGAFGAFMVYPIDLVKTRMQNQRSGRVGQVLYRNSIDCFQKVIRNEGFRGLYSGVIPQLVGVAPEKAIKLTVNDLVRGKFTDAKTGNIAVAAEILAGAMAGMCQVIFTNPLEIVKIRLQIQGEALKAAERAGELFEKRSAAWVVRNLGLKGLYKGAPACLLRDMPFSAIYFPTYNHLKRDLFKESPTNKLGVLQLLTAAGIAGMPAAYLVTPADVIKTRLQVTQRKGETNYNGIFDATRKIFKEEGIAAFFKGGPARVLRSSPQFAFTLAGYEVLQNMLPMPGEERQTAPITPVGEGAPGLPESGSPLAYLRSRNALKVIMDLDLGFGRIHLKDQAKQEMGGVMSKLGFKGEKQ